MLEKQQKHHSFLDPQEHGGIVDSRPWLSEGPRRSSSSSSPPPLSSSSTVAPSNDGNVDKVLFKNLVEMVPLVESLMDKRANSSFTRRASMIYTPTPSQPKQIVGPKGRKVGQTLSSKKGRDLGENASNLHIKRDNQDGGADDFSLFSRQLAEETTQKDREELSLLRQQLEELQKKLSEKDEILKSTESSLNQMSSVYTTVDELKRQVSDKESSVKSAQSQLYNAQIKLADKQAALEKLEWEARTSNIKIEKLQGDLDSIEFQMTAFMVLFEELVNCEPAASVDENITVFHHFDNLSNIDFDENGAEDARKAYVAAVSAAKENPSDESIASAAAARLRLQAFVL